MLVSLLIIDFPLISDGLYLKDSEKSTGIRHGARDAARAQVFHASGCGLYVIQTRDRIGRVRGEIRDSHSLQGVITLDKCPLVVQYLLKYAI